MKRDSESGKNNDFAFLMFELIAGIVGFGFLGGIGVLVYQIYWYLRIGEWYSFSVITGLRWLNVQWAFYPTEWIGIYKILDEFPLCLGMFICGLIPLFLLCSIVVAYDKYRSWIKKT
jgi:hypothetical protein